LTFTLRVRRAAELEISEAQLWYEAKEKGLAAEFLSEVSQTIDRILETPLIYQHVHRGIRRAILHRFPYLIWYQVGSRFGLHLRWTRSCAAGSSGPMTRIVSHPLELRITR